MQTSVATGRPLSVNRRTGNEGDFVDHEDDDVVDDNIGATFKHDMMAIAQRNGVPWHGGALGSLGYHSSLARHRGEKASQR